MPRKYLWSALAAISITVLTMLVSIAFLNSSQYQALAGGVQAVGVTAALVFGAATLHTDGHNRRVDRVLDLHHDLTEGDLQAARLRVIEHLRGHSHGMSMPRVRLQQFREGGDLSRYAASVSGTPAQDVARLLRYMERVNAARRAGILEDSLLHELVGLHAMWWNQVIIQDEVEPLCQPIANLAAWAIAYSNTRAVDTHYLHLWNVNFRRDFGRGIDGQESQSET